MENQTSWGRQTQGMRKLHLVADSARDEIIWADLSLSATKDEQTPPGLINQTHRKIREASADGSYDTRYCHDALLRKKIRPLIPSSIGAQHWTDMYPERNHAGANQHQSGSNEVWKKIVDYHRHSVAETAIYRIKTLLGSYLRLRGYDAQVDEAIAIVKALTRVTLLGMPHRIWVT